MRLESVTVKQGRPLEVTIHLANYMGDDQATLKFVPDSAFDKLAQLVERDPRFALGKSTI